MAVTETIRVRATWDGKDLSTGTKQASKDMDRMSKATNLAGKAFGALGIGLTIAGLVQMSRALVRTADQWTNITNRIKLFTTSAAETIKVQEQLFQISQKTRASMSATTELFQRLSQANKALKLDQDALQGVLTTLNQTLVISGTSAESARAGLIQLGQAFASGQLRGEELRSVMEQMPRLTQVLLAGLNTGVAGLRKMAEAGELTADRVVKAIQSQAAVVDIEFQGMEKTVEQASTGLANSMGKFIDKLNEAVEVTLMLSRALTSMSDILDKLGDTSFPLAPTGFSALQAQVKAREQGGATIFQARESFQRRVPQSIEGTGLSAGRDVADVRFLTDTINQAIDRLFGIDLQRERERAAFGIPGAPISIQPLPFGPARGGIDIQSQSDAIFDRQQSIIDNAFPTTGAFDVPAAIDFGITELNEVGRQLEGVRAGEMALSEARNILALSTATANERELMLMDARQREAIVTADLAGATDEQLGALRNLQQQQTTAVIIAQQERQNRKEEMALRLEQHRAQQEFNRSLGAGVAVLRRIIPEFSSFIGAISSLAQGDVIGGIAQGMIGLIDTLGLGASANSAYRREIENTNRSLQIAASSASSFARSMGIEVSKELLSLKNDALIPLRNLFQLLQASAPDETIVQHTEDFFKALEIGTSGRSNVFDPGFDLTNISEQLDAALFLTGTSFADFMAKLRVSFGADTARNLQDVGRQMFTVRDALLDMGDAAQTLADVLDPARRVISSEADFQQGRLRQQARLELQQAGGSGFEQARIFRALQRDVQNVAARESAQLAAVGRAPGAAQVAATTPGGGAAAKVGGGGVATPGLSVSPVIDIDPVILAPEDLISLPTSQDFQNFYRGAGGLLDNIEDGLSETLQQFTSAAKGVGFNVALKPEDFISLPTSQDFQDFYRGVGGLLDVIEDGLSETLQQFTTAAKGVGFNVKLLPGDFISLPTSEDFQSFYRGVGGLLDNIEDGLSEVLQQFTAAAKGVGFNVKLLPEDFISLPTSEDFQSFYRGVGGLLDHIEDGLSETLQQFGSAARGVGFDVKLLPGDFVTLPTSEDFQDFYRGAGGLLDNIEDGLSETLQQFSLAAKGVGFDVMLLPADFVTLPTSKEFQEFYRGAGGLLDNIEDGLSETLQQFTSAAKGVGFDVKLDPKDFVTLPTSEEFQVFYRGVGGLLDHIEDGLKPTLEQFEKAAKGVGFDVRLIPEDLITLPTSTDFRNFYQSVGGLLGVIEDGLKPTLDQFRKAVKGVGFIVKTVPKDFIELPTSHDFDNFYRKPEGLAGRLLFGLSETIEQANLNVQGFKVLRTAAEWVPLPDGIAFFHHFAILPERIESGLAIVLDNLSLDPVSITPLDVVKLPGTVKWFQAWKANLPRMESGLELALGLFTPVTVDAGDLIKIEIGDLFTAESIREAVVEAVTRALRDRSL